MKRFILIIFLFLGGCDLLSTRAPEEPENRPRNYLVPTTADLVISNLKESLKDGYVEYYLECFADQTFINKKFRFIPAASALQSFPVFNDWGIEGEKQYFNKLKSLLKENTGVSLTFSDLEYNPQGSGSTIVTASYNLSFQGKDTSFPSQYQGFLQLNLSTDNRGQWVIVEWIDFKKDNFNSWSELKGRLY